MKTRISVLLAFIISITCLLSNVPMLAAQPGPEQQETNVDAYYYGAGSDTCYKKITSSSLTVSYGEKYGRDVVLEACANMNVRTASKETYTVNGLHIAIENFKGDGLSFWLSNKGTSNAQNDNALRFVFKNGSHLGVNYGTNRWSCDESVPFTGSVSGKLDIYISENADKSVTVTVNGTEFTVPAEKVAENITDIGAVYVQFSTVPQQGFDSASFTLTSIHNGACKTGTIVNNKNLTPKYVPDSEVTVDENGSPDWLSQLVIAEVKIASASPERTFEGAVRLLDLYEEMGVNGIWLNPIHDGYDFDDSNAGYANAGPHTVNANLTGTTDYEKGWQVVKNFVDEAHKRNIRVFFDAITWGVDNSSPLITEHPDWFSGTAWGGAAFNWSNTGLREWYINTWVDNMVKTGADGIRCDCEPQYTGYSIFQSVRAKLAEKGRKIALMSEQTNSRGTAGSYAYDMEQWGVNVTGSTEVSMTMANNIFMSGMNIVKACTTGEMIGSIDLQKQGQGGEFKYYTFLLSCHDHQIPCAKGKRTYAAYQAILAPFIPIWFMGEEWYDNSNNGIQYCKTLNWDKLYRYENREFFEDYKKYIGIRWTYPEIFGYFPDSHRDTNICEVEITSGGVTTIEGAYGRYGGGKGVIVAMNKVFSTEKTLKVPFSNMQLPNVTKYVIKDLLTGETIAQGSKAEVEAFTVHIEKDYVGVYLIEAAPDAVEIKNGIALIDQSTYELTDAYVMRVGEKTSVSDFIAQFKYQDTLRLLNADGTEVTTGYVGTGFILQSLLGSDIIDEKMVIVSGDTDGDGQITSTDYLKIKKYFINTDMLQGAFYAAADITGDGEITSTDYLKVKRYFNGGALFG